MNELISKLKVMDEIYNISMEEGFNNWNAHKVLNRVMYNVLHMKDESTENCAEENKEVGEKFVECGVHDAVACSCLCNNCLHYSYRCCQRTTACPITKCDDYVARK